MKKFRFSDFRKNAMPLLGLAILANSVPQASAATIYGYAQQKVYDMTLSSSTPSTTITPTIPLTVTTSTSATLNGFAISGFNLPQIDAQQAKTGIFASPGLPAGRINPPENYIGPAPYASTPGTNVLAQANPTPVGNMPIGSNSNLDTTVPMANSFNPGDEFTRADVYMSSQTGNPIAGTNPLQGAPPAGIPTNGQNINTSMLFAAPGTGNTMAFDSNAEGVITSSTVTTGISNSSWVISGAFNLSAPGTVELDFNIVERLVVFSDSSPTTQAYAINRLNLLISDSNNVPVANPSSARSLTAPIAGEGTYNAFSLTAGHSWSGINNLNPVAFQSTVLPAGNYTFSISGITQVDLTTVPEPSTYALMGIASAVIGGLARNRRKQKASSIVQS